MLGFKQYTSLMEDNAKEVAAKYPHIAHVDPRVLSSFGHRLGKITSSVMDKDKINDIATEFHKNRDALKATGEHDINKHVSLDSMEASVAKLKAKKAAKEDVKILHHDPKTGVTIKHVRTKEACQKGYGGGKTNWCTAASGSGNLFDSYGKSGKKMITIHHGETVYGVHEHEGGVIRDVENNEVSHQQRDSNNKRGPQQIHPDISKAMAKTPELTKINLVSENPHFEPTQEHIDAAMKDPDGSAAKLLLSSYKDQIKPHHIDAAMSHPDGRVADIAMEHHGDKITPKHHAILHKKIMDSITNDDVGTAKETMRSHKEHITQEHVDAAFSRKPQDDDGDANYSLMTHVMRDHTKMGVNYINRMHAAKTGEKEPLIGDKPRN
jgi:hypothetical protein